MIRLHFVRKFFNGIVEGVRGQNIRKNSLKANYSRQSISTSLIYTSKFIFVAVVLAILVGGCLDEKKKIEELPKIGPFLEDELDNYKVDDDLELMIFTFEELSGTQKRILSNFGEIKESVPPISGKGLIESDYWRTSFETKKRYLGNISKTDFVDKIEKLPSKDSEYLDKTDSTLVQAALFLPNNKSLGVIIGFKHEIRSYEEDKLNGLGLLWDISLLSLKHRLSSMKVLFQ